MIVKLSFKIRLFFFLPVQSLSLTRTCPRPSPNHPPKYYTVILLKCYRMLWIFCLFVIIIYLRLTLHTASESTFSDRLPVFILWSTFYFISFFPVFLILFLDVFLFVGGQSYCFLGLIYYLSQTKSSITL